MLLLMRFDRIEGLVAYVVLDAAGVLGSCFLVDPDADEHFGENYMTLVDLLGSGCALARELERTVFSDLDHVFFLEDAECAADGGLAEAHVVADVDGADIRVFLGKNIYSLEIHLA